MNDPSSVVTSRRGLLRGIPSLSLVGTGACLRRSQSILGRDGPDPVTLSIKTTPADDDPYAIRIARRLATNMKAAGVGVKIIPMRIDELLRDLLINHTFDLYVSTHLGGHDPDFLYPLLHSRYNQEPGWQNPFGYADIQTDELLTRQREHTGAARRAAVAELQKTIVRNQPFTTLAFPDRIRAVRSEQTTDQTTDPFGTPLAYIGLERGDGESETTRTGPDGDSMLRVTLTDGRVTENLNPLAAEFRDRGLVTGLLYDSLGRRHRDGVRPWLAESWRLVESNGRLDAIVRVRDDLVWHDGRRLTADDVAFTYRFLADTSLGRSDRSVPAPRFRGHVSLVESVEVSGSNTLRIRTAATDPAVARRVFTVPVLPEHEWRPRSAEAGVVGIDLSEGMTEALVWNNLDPVGSGPLRFSGLEHDERLVLERFDRHFLGDSPEGISALFDGGFPYDRLEFRIVPSSGAAIQLIASGDADATASSVGPGSVPDIGRAEGVKLVVGRSRAFYHVGFNARRAPLGNPRFRRTVARLLDRGALVGEAFGGYATPATSPLAETEWATPDQEWSADGSPLAFLGSNGQIDGKRARKAFVDAGYRYDRNGRLLGQRNP